MTKVYLYHIILTLVSILDHLRYFDIQLVNVPNLNHILTRFESSNLIKIFSIDDPILLDHIYIYIQILVLICHLLHLILLILNPNLYFILHLLIVISNFSLLVTDQLLHL